MHKEIIMTDDNSVDKSFENETPAPSPMVQISIKEYDKLKEHQKYIQKKSFQKIQAGKFQMVLQNQKIDWIN